MMDRIDVARGPLDSDQSLNLAVIRSTGGVVLGRKTRGFGTGRLVLPGGKDRYFVSGAGVGLVPGTVDVAREVSEETGLNVDPRQFKQRATLHVCTDGGTKTITVYEAQSRQVPLKSTDELADLRWHNEQALAYGDMPKDYRLWLPHVLAGYAVTAFFDLAGDGVLDGTVFRRQLEPLGLPEMLPVAVCTS